MASIQNHVKTMVITIETAQVDPDLLTVQASLSDRTVRRSEIKQKDLKPYVNQKNGQISNLTNRPIFLKLFKHFDNNRKNTNKMIVFNPLSSNPTKWSNTLKQFVG